MYVSVGTKVGLEALLLAQAWEWKFLNLSQCHGWHWFPGLSARLTNLSYHQQMEYYSIHLRLAKIEVVLVKAVWVVLKSPSSKGQYSLWCEAYSTTRRNAGQIRVLHSEAQGPHTGAVNTIPTEPPLQPLICIFFFWGKYRIGLNSTLEWLLCLTHIAPWPSSSRI